MHNIVIIIGGMMTTTGMKITMRGMVNMTKALDSIKNLTFHNLMEENIDKFLDWLNMVEHVFE